MHYGLAWDPTVTVEQAGRQFQSVFRALGELPGAYTYSKG